MFERWIIRIDGIYSLFIMLFYFTVFDNAKIEEKSNNEFYYTNIFKYTCFLYRIRHCEHFKNRRIIRVYIEKSASTIHWK